MGFAFYLLATIAIWSFYMSYSKYREQKILLKRGIVADGRISKIIKERDPEHRNHIVEHPYMEYEDRDGVKHEYMISTTTGLAKYRYGEMFKLLYDPEQKFEPLILTKFGIWGSVLGLFFFGLCWAGFAVLHAKGVLW